MNQGEFLGKDKLFPRVYDRDIPERFRKWELTDYSYMTIEAKRRITQWFTNDEWCMYIHGETGARKTSFACAILKYLRRDGIMPLSGYGEVIMPDTWAVIQREQSELSKLRLQQWKQSRFILFDDLGKHRDTPHLIEAIMLFLHSRYDRWKMGQKTIITSNMNMGELANKIDPATARRIDEGFVLKLELHP
jgi:DNA replication protein DnaC